MYYANFVDWWITPEQGARRGLEIGSPVAEKAEKILNRGNEAKDLLKRKGLSFSGAQNELVFDCQKRQSKLRNGPKLRHFFPRLIKTPAHFWQVCGIRVRARRLALLRKATDQTVTTLSAPVNSPTMSFIPPTSPAATLPVSPKCSRHVRQATKRTPCPRSIRRPNRAGEPSQTNLTPSV
jgi:hypothetical protein